MQRQLRTTGLLASLGVLQILSSSASAGLVAHWRLDGNAGDSAGSHHGTHVGIPSYTTGAIGLAITLNGVDQTVSIPHASALKPANQITISAWVKPTDLNVHRAIYRKEDGNDRHLLMFDQRGWFSFGLGINGAYDELRPTISATDYLDGKWHLVTATYDGSSMRVYADGKEIGSTPKSGLIGTAGTSPVYIGANAGSVEWFAGGIDDVRLYNHALSLSEIWDIIPSPVSISESAGSTQVTEDGPGSDTYQVQLATAPSANVSVTVQPDNQTEINGGGAGNPVVLLFTTGDWSGARTVTVTAIDDSAPEGAHVSTIRHSSTSADSTYDDILIRPIWADVIDDEYAVVIVESQGGTEVDEQQPSSDDYTLVLSIQPSANVVVTVDPDTQSEVNSSGAGNPVDVTFTPTDWSTPRPVTLQAIDDSASEPGHHRSLIAHTAASADTNYAGIAVRDVMAVVTDNEPWWWQHAGAVPGGLGEGATLVGDFYWFVAGGVVAAIDADTGSLAGIYSGQHAPLVSWGHDIYFIETEPKDPANPLPTYEDWESDERFDVVTLVTTAAQELAFTCQNPDLPGITIDKRYRFGTIQGEDRALDKTITATGNPSAKTLLHIVSRTRLDPAFRNSNLLYSLFYSRTSPHYSVFPADDVTAPIDFGSAGGILGTADAWAQAEFTAVNTASDQGLSHYWFTANGRCAKPLGYVAHSSWVTDQGWDMSWFATFVKPGGDPDTQTATQRFHLFTGDRTTYHREYVSLPEYQAENNVAPVSPRSLLRRYEQCFVANQADLEFFYSRVRSKEVVGHFVMGFRDLYYPDHPTGDGAVLRQGGEPGAGTHPAINIKNAIAAGKAARPRILSGWYDPPQHINVNSLTAAAEPGWFLRNKFGDMAPSGWSPFYFYANFSPEFINWILARYQAQADYYDTQVIYSDWNAQGPVVDWPNHIVRQTEDSITLRNGLAQIARDSDGIYWANCSSWDGMQDISYWESIGNYGLWDGWRNFAEPLMIRRIQMRPGQMLIPLYWANQAPSHPDNYEDYLNAVLALCLGTAQCGYNPVSLWHDQYGVLDRDAMNSQWIAYYDTAFEMYRSSWADVDIEPAWWRDFATEIQAAAFTLGPGHIFTALNHGARSSPTLTADADLMGLSTATETFVWQHDPRDPVAYPKHAGVQPENWDLLFTTYVADDNNQENRTAAVLPPGAFQDRISIDVPNLVSERTRMITVTQVPAVFYSMEGQRLNLLLPETLGSAIDGPFNRNGEDYALTVSAQYPSEILVYRPTASTPVAVDGIPVTPTVMPYAGSTFVKIGVPEGESTVTVGAPDPSTMLIIR